MNDPRPTLEEVQAFQVESEKIAALYAASTAAAFHLAMYRYFQPREGCSDAGLNAWLLELKSRLEQLQGWQMGAEEPTWKAFSERHPETVEPLLVRWPDKDCGGYIYNVFQVGLTEKRLAEEGAKYAQMGMEWMVIPNG